MQINTQTNIISEQKPTNKKEKILNLVNKIANFYKTVTDQKLILKPQKCTNCPMLQTGIVEGFCCIGCKTDKKHSKLCYQIDFQDKDWKAKVKAKHAELGDSVKQIENITQKADIFDVKDKIVQQEKKEQVIKINKVVLKSNNDEQNKQEQIMNIQQKLAQIRERQKERKQNNQSQNVQTNQKQMPKDKSPTKQEFQKQQEVDSKNLQVLREKSDDIFLTNQKPIQSIKVDKDKKFISKNQIKIKLNTSLDRKQEAKKIEEKKDEQTDENPSKQVNNYKLIQEKTQKIQEILGGKSYQYLTIVQKNKQLPVDQLVNLISENKNKVK